jgi:ribosomal protein S18 acetylase RimI-like enzyme
MKLVRWTRFTWDLTKLAPVYPAIDSHYRVRQATLEDEKAVRTAIISAFTLDSNWNYALRELRGQVDTALSQVFHEKGSIPCMVVTHGNRVIGASALNTGRDADNHLLTGPCILIEYRNRGLATALLAESLVFLRDLGMTQANALTKQDSPTAKFLYTKFGSKSTPYESESHLAAS